MKAVFMIGLCFIMACSMFADPALAQSLKVKLNGVKDNTLAMNSSAPLVIMGGRAPFTVTSYSPAGLAVKVTPRGHTLTGKKPGTYFVRVGDSAKRTAVIQVTVVQSMPGAGEKQIDRPVQEGSRPQAMKPGAGGDVN